MAAARRPPSSEAAKVQFLGPMANGAQLALGVVIRDAELPIVEEARERTPTLEGMIDRFAGLTMF